MNLNKYCKLLTVLITFIISIIYTFLTNQRFAFNYNTTLLIFIFANSTTIMLNLKNKDALKKSIIFTSSILIIFISIHTFQIIIDYIKFKHLTLDTDWYFITILCVTLIESIFNLKKETNQINDILTIIVCILISLIQYRYYIDPNFVHNLINLSKNNTIYQNSFIYVEQYYLSFTIILTILNINNFISKIDQNQFIKWKTS